MGAVGVSDERHPRSLSRQLAGARDGERRLARPTQRRAAHGHHTALQIAGVVKPAPTASNVEVIKQGDKVVRLVIKCSCGELIEIECLYPAGS